MTFIILSSGVIALEHFNLAGLSSFGEVDAEREDILLEYFMPNSTVWELENESKCIIVGRKGTGKTAIAKYFTESSDSNVPNKCASRLLDMQHYPWERHRKLVDLGASKQDAYLTSWKYVIAVNLASLLVNCLEDDKARQLPEFSAIQDYLVSSYHIPDPSLVEIVKPKFFRLTKFTVDLKVLSTEHNATESHRQGPIDAIANSLLGSIEKIFEHCTGVTLSVHFDGIDHACDENDRQRLDDMIRGLLFASIYVTAKFKKKKLNVRSLVYLRSDIWFDLDLGQKRKVEAGYTVHLTWNPEQLKHLFECRLDHFVHPGAKWESIVKNHPVGDKRYAPKHISQYLIDLVRPSDQSAGKLVNTPDLPWGRVVDLTFWRPRDIVMAANMILVCAKNRCRVENESMVLLHHEDFVLALQSYTEFMKAEFKDELFARWNQFSDTCEALATLKSRVSSRDTVSHALEQRFRAEEVDLVIRKLYDLGILGFRQVPIYGSRDKGNAAYESIFSYSHSEVFYNEKAEWLVIHPSFAGAFGVV